ncbi:MAG: acyl--CoA ligase [Planctomycetes bacterium]|nr:acyl--CoA ligase [Planctomycetota bacterium]
MAPHPQKDLLMQVHHFLELSAQKVPAKPAVWFQEKWLTYAQLEAFANQLGNYLKESGVQRGDRVALLFENSFDYIIAYFAILKAGGIVVSLNIDTPADGLVYCLQHAGARAIVTDARLFSRIAPALPQLPALKDVAIAQDDLSRYEGIKSCRLTRLQDIYAQGNVRPPGVRSIDLDMAMIVYTSGTTGKPKGVTISHLNLVSNTRSIVEYLELTPRDRVRVVLPFYYIYGKSLLNTHFFAGGSVVLDNRFAYPQVILENMQKTQVTGFAGVPLTFLILLNKSAIKNYTFPSLRYVTQAGGAMAPAIQKQVAEVFAPAKLYVMYGATEAAPRLTYLDPAMLPKKWGSIGKAIPNVEVFVADENGRPLQAGEIGQIVARGSNIMQSYWNDPAGTAEVLKRGLYFTGDSGRVDEEGFLYVVGRARELLKPGGFRVSALEVEDAALGIAEVQEVAVIGVEDPNLGEAIKMFVVAREGVLLTEEKIRKHLKEKLPIFKQPKFIEFRSNLPKNSAGKIVKAVLREEQVSPKRN